MELKEFLERTVRVYISKGGHISEIARPVIVCKDGFAMHVDAALSRPTYSKISVEGWGLAYVNYETVEITALSGPIAGIEEYRRDFLAAYAFVPVEKVQEVIDSHGGIDEDKTWNGYKETTPCGIPIFKRYVYAITDVKHEYRGFSLPPTAYDEVE